MYFIFQAKMWVWDKILASIISVSMLGWSPKCSEDVKSENFKWNSNVIETVDVGNVKDELLPSISEIQKDVKKQISVCLVTDAENTFTHTKVLEKVSDPQNIILEFPISQLFQKYWNRNHPLSVSGVGRNFRALLWKDWIERLSSKVPQKLNRRKEKVTSDTKYEVGDTLRFSLIDPLLKSDFPYYLSDQLKEDGFKWFSDSEASILAKIIANKNKIQKTQKKSDFIYDIVVKRVPSWKSALALYRDGELFMATYASVWLNNRRTLTWQFEVLSKNPYKRSHKYNNAAMPEALNFCGWFYIHQWNVTWYPASHWCVRLPWIYANVLYSSVKDLKHTDIFISKNLYKSQK